MKRNPWPYAIVLYFVIFISAMATWIGFAVRNDPQLVRKDYYEQELKFQTDIDGRERAAAVGVQVGYDAAKQIVTVAVPREAAGGTAYFYRPSNARLDREITLALKDGVQAIDVHDFEAGLWKVRLTWMANGAEFRHSATLVFAPMKVSLL